MPLLNRSTGDGAECDDVGVDVGAADDVDGAGVLGLANDAKRLMYLVLQQNWSNSSWMILRLPSPIGQPISSR
jgi:hypothetical protein